MKAKELTEKTYSLKRKELTESEENKSSNTNTNTTAPSPDLNRLADSIEKLANKQNTSGNITINADVSNLMSETWIRNNLAPKLNKVNGSFR